MKRALAALLCVGLLVPSSVEAGTRARTELLITDHVSSYWRVAVDSPRKRCEANRYIDIFQKLDGDDLKVATGITSEDSAGNWHADILDPDPVAGTYYAKGFRKDGCRRGRSPDYIYTPE